MTTTDIQLYEQQIRRMADAMALQSTGMRADVSLPGSLYSHVPPYFLADFYVGIKKIAPAKEPLEHTSRGGYAMVWDRAHDRLQGALTNLALIWSPSDNLANDIGASAVTDALLALDAIYKAAIGANNQPMADKQLALEIESVLGRFKLEFTKSCPMASESHLWPKMTQIVQLFSPAVQTMKEYCEHLEQEFPKYFESLLSIQPAQVN